MDHLEISERLESYAKAELASAEAAEVARHLEGCESCRRARDRARPAERPCGPANRGPCRIRAERRRPACRRLPGVANPAAWAWPAAAMAAFAAAALWLSIGSTSPISGLVSTLGDLLATSLLAGAGLLGATWRGVGLAVRSAFAVIPWRSWAWRWSPAFRCSASIASSCALAGRALRARRARDCPRRPCARRERQLLARSRSLLLDGSAGAALRPLRRRRLSTSPPEALLRARSSLWGAISSSRVRPGRRRRVARIGAHRRPRRRQRDRALGRCRPGADGSRRWGSLRARWPARDRPPRR